MSKISITNIPFMRNFGLLFNNQCYLTTNDKRKYFDQGSKYSFLLQYCYIVKQPGNEIVVIHLRHHLDLLPNILKLILLYTFHLNQLK